MSILNHLYQVFNLYLFLHQSAKLRTEGLGKSHTRLEELGRRVTANIAEIGYHVSQVIVTALPCYRLARIARRRRNFTLQHLQRLVETKQSQVGLWIHTHIFTKHTRELLLPQTSRRGHVGRRELLLVAGRLSRSAVSGQDIAEDIVQAVYIDIAFRKLSQSAQEEVVEQLDSLLHTLRLMNLEAQFQKIIIVQFLWRSIGTLHLTGKEDTRAERYELSTEDMKGTFRRVDTHLLHVLMEECCAVRPLATVKPNSLGEIEMQAGCPVREYLLRASRRALCRQQPVVADERAQRFVAGYRFEFHLSRLGD